VRIAERVSWDWLSPALVVQLLAVAAWLWPIGVGGKMPVGGDVTAFSIGLMAVLARSLRAWRLPLWNDLWGYGFPGVGESQMGVYYPPHWLLYGALPLEAAYTASLVLHTLWGSAGAYWCARRFGASRVGSALTGFSWSTCGFFAIHLTHQWGYTTGSWMPWAWGLAWSVLQGGGRRQPFWLALVVAVQLLPGHFQLAFCTQVGVVVLVVQQAAERLLMRSGGLAGAVKTLAALGAAFPMAASQLWPTLRLARLASPRRDFEYLSGFAASPLHLVTFFAPGLFERSPLWRPLVWDPFHTSPEEYLGYVGLVPLFLALGAIGSGIRTSPAVRALVAVGVVTTWLVLGPYVPGFLLLNGLPGFSFFRAPARWTLALSLALCLLAGLGFDRLPVWKRLGRDLVRFAAVAVLAPVVVVLLVEGALFSTARPGWPAVAAVYARALDALPWREAKAFRSAIDAARRPNTDLRVSVALARQGVQLAGAPRPVFSERRLAVYRQELAGSFAVLLGLVAVAPMAERRGFVRRALVALTFLDLGVLAPPARVDFGPIAPLVEQSPVLARLAGLPRGNRTLDRSHNLPMAVGAAPVSDYRTLDLRALRPLTVLAEQIGLGRPGSGSGLIAESLRLTGASVRVFDPSEALDLARLKLDPPGAGRGERVSDPALARWQIGADLVAQQPPAASTFLVAPVRGGGVRAWLVPLTPARSAAILGEWSEQALDALAALRDATPLDLRRPDPERRELDVEVSGPSLVVVSELADPQWEAVWSGRDGEQQGKVLRAFGVKGEGAWQAVEVPGAGSWRLWLTYRARDVTLGLAVSAVALAGWAVAMLLSGRERGPTPSTSGEAEQP
jgi:hypothetical protein